MDLPIYELKIQEDLGDSAEVSYIALVDKPAIQKDFVVFNQDFVQPSKGEGQDAFLPRCIKYVIDEGKDSEQAVAICNSIWDQHFAAPKVSFDYDDTLSTDRGKAMAKKAIENGNTLYIISARHDKEGMLSVAKDLGIPESRVYATGSNKAKVEKVKELGITKHIDNNADVIKELGPVGSKFYMLFAIQSEDKHIISGPLMLADEPIYRNNSKFGEHYVIFKPETIKDISIKFAKKGYQQNVNLMHDSDMRLDGLVMFESFIVDRSRGILPMEGFEDAKDGSWFGSFYVENPQAWQLIKEGKVKGFSVEGFFDYALPDNREKSYAEQKLAELAELLKVPYSTI
jgi:hypothetical protein